MNKEDSQRIGDIEERAMAGEEIPPEDANFLLTELNILQLKLVDADVLAMTVDVSLDRGNLRSRELIADARIIYGNYWEYEHATEEDLLGFRNGIHEVRERYAKKD